MIGRAMGTVWGQIVDISFAATGSVQFLIPHGHRLSDIRRQLEFKLVLNHGVGTTRDRAYIAASATWLQLPYTELT